MMGPYRDNKSKETKTDKVCTRCTRRLGLGDFGSLGEGLTCKHCPGNPFYFKSQQKTQ